MSNEKFKVKFGLAVGDTAVTIDGTTGNIVTNGDLTVGGTNINTGITGDGTTGQIQIDKTTTQTNAASAALTLRSTSTGTPVVGFGTGQIYSIQTGASTYVNGAAIAAYSTNITPGSEVCDMNFQTMTAGVLNTKFTLFGNGDANLTGDLIIGGGGITLNGSTNGSSTFNAPATGSTLVYTLPGSQGAANTALTNDGSGNLTWALPGGGGSTFGNITVGVVTDNTISTSTGDLLLDSTTGVVKTVGDITIGGNDIKASDGTTALSLTTSSGNVTVAGDLFVGGNDILSNGGFSNINFPLSTSNVKIIGDLILGGNDIQASDGTTAITTSTSTGNVALAGNLDVQGGTITESTGALSITTGAANGAITLVPNGSGSVALTLANGGNLTNTRNYVLGAVRDATTLANGDAWSFSSGAGTGYRGISIDNSANTAKAPATILRSFTGGAVAGNATTPAVLFERARGTSAAPTAIQSGDFLGRFLATGANGAGTFIGDTVAASPAALTFFAAENFVSNTNVGTQMSVALMPTGKTLASVATPTVVLNITPQTNTQRSDSFTWQNGNTIANANQNTKLTLDSTGQLIAYGNITALGTLTFNNELAVNATSELLDTNTAAGTSLAIQTNYRPSSGSATYSVPQTGWQLGNFRFNSYSTTGGAYVLGAQVSATATENWTSTANGSSINFFANKKLQSWTPSGSINVISASPETTIFQSDAFTFKNSSSVKVTGNKIDYNRVYGAFQYNTTVTPAAANTAYVFPIGTVDFSNIVSVGSTSRIIIGAPGIYNLQFSVQVENTTNAAEHIAYIWIRKNGTDIPASTGRITLAKSASTIAGWNYVIDSANTTDYYEIAYAVNDTAVIFPTYAATAFGPSTASLITTITPVGA